MKIALIGSAPSSVGIGPYEDKTYAQYIQGKPIPKYPPAKHAEEVWEIWCCSPGAFGPARRATRWFEVHRWEPGQTWFSPEYCQFLREFRGPVYTGRPIPEIVNHVVYPVAAVEDEFSPYFLTSSLSLMFAQAIREIEEIRRLRKEAKGHKAIFGELLAESSVLTQPHASQADHLKDEYDLTDEDDTIGLWGVDMSATEEFGYQRAGCHHFVLTALDRYIGVYVPPESDLLRPMPVYGICEWDHEYIKMTARSREFSARINQARQQKYEGELNERFMQGAMDNLNYTVNTWTSPYGLPHGEVLRKKK